jgi:hypothetical protein
MPCITCNNLFYNKPCSKEANQQDDMFYPHVKPNTFFQTANERMFIALKEYCPCQICLVKVMCHKFCERYVTYRKKTL